MSKTGIGLIVGGLLLLACATPPASDTQATAEADCRDAVTTREMNACLAQQARAAEAQMADYLAASRAQLDEDAGALKALEAAQARWVDYRDAHCEAIYDYWQDGTIRGAMYAGCRIRLAQDRSHVLWQAYLIPMDSSEPVRPEPERD